MSGRREPASSGPGRALTGPAAAALLAVGACAAAPPVGPSTWIAPSQGTKDARSGSSLEQYFPLVDGQLYQYVTLNEMNERGLLVARVFRKDDRHGELRFPGGAKRFEYADDGLIVRDRERTGYVLKAPLEAGASWRGEHGGLTRILTTSTSVDVPAGHFDGCLQTIEERLGDRPARFTTTFCPGTGVVLLEAAGGTSLERAELKSYGAPMTIGPDGLQRVE